MSLRKCFPLLFLLWRVVAGAQVADLSSWDPSQKNIITLDQKWEFYWNKLLSPADLGSSHSPSPDTLLVPSSWSDVKLHGRSIGSTGCATYRLILKDLPKEELALDIYSVQTSCRVFANGKLLAEVGSPGRSREETVPATRDVEVDLPQDSSALELIVQVANFHHRKGGFVHPFEIGTVKAIVAQRQLYYILAFVESSALAILGLFLFALYIFRRKDLSVLYFALFCITLSFRPVISVNYLLSALFPGLGWFLLLKMEYFSVLFPCLFMLLFIKKLFPEQLPSVIVRVLTFILTGMLLIVLCTPPIVFSWLVLPLLFIISIGVVIFAITIVRAVIAGVEGTNFAGAGIFILLTSLLFKVLVYAGIMSPVHVLITVLDIAFIFTMSLVLGARFSLQFVKVETLRQKTEQQHYELEGKNKEVEKQKEALEEKNKEILDSITYAKRIQYAILPSQRSFREYFPESFILYKPKDIVAGDFYFLEPAGDRVIFAVADCTGHGVPGALVSVVCSNALNRAVKEFGLTEPGQILGIVRQLVTETFDKSESDVKDGMDISIFTFYPQQMKLQWAGANNPLWLIRDHSLKEFSPDKQSIGRTDDPKPFATHSIPIQKGDNIYLFTDGYADQFGGPRGKKFRYKQFQELILSIHLLPPGEQAQRLEQAFADWKAQLEQVDDVCVAGIRFT